jgi:1-acyl-sn-glycerol-3-phosphate acyltransferase
MIRAAEKRWFKKIWHIYVRYYLLWRHFSIIRLKGNVDPLDTEGAPFDKKTPSVIYIANHSNWWDGLLAYDAYLPRSRYKHFIMMDEKQLRDFKFFTFVGVFSIDKSKSSAIMESLNYATTLLRQQHAVWIFPQGDIAHLEKRPLDFFSGVGYLLQQCPDAVVVPVTMYYSFCHLQRPEASLWFGAPLAHAWDDLDRKEITKYLRDQLEIQLNEHRDLYISGAIGGVNPMVADNDSHAHGFKATLRITTTDEWFVGFKKWVKRWFMFWRR